MDYLHNSFVGPHGHLSSKSCLVDARYSCKITDYGVNWLRERYLDPATDEEDADGKVHLFIYSFIHYYATEAAHITLQTYKIKHKALKTAKTLQLM